MSTNELENSDRIAGHFKWWMDHAEDPEMRGPTRMAAVLELKYRHQINARIKNDSFKAEEIAKALSFWGLSYEEFIAHQRDRTPRKGKKEASIEDVIAQLASALQVAKELKRQQRKLAKETR